MTQPIEPAEPTAPAETSDRGFPEATPLTQMTDAQQAAYWKHYARQHEDAVKAFKGLTPQQVTDLQVKIDALEAEKLTADEKALAAAKKEAAETAAAAAKAEYLPKLHAAEVKSIASDVISGDQLKSFMSVVNPAAFLSDAGEIDEAKVMGALTGMFGTPTQNTPRWQNAGQYTPPPPPSKPGESGRAEAAKRFGTKSKSTQ